MLITVVLAWLCHVQELSRAAVTGFVLIWRLVCRIAVHVMLHLAPGCYQLAAMVHALI